MRQTRAYYVKICGCLLYCDKVYDKCFFLKNAVMTSIYKGLSAIF